MHDFSLLLSHDQFDLTNSMMLNWSVEMVLYISFPDQLHSVLLHPDLVESSSQPV